MTSNTAMERLAKRRVGSVRLLLCAAAMAAAAMGFVVAAASAGHADCGFDPRGPLPLEQLHRADAAVVGVVVARRPGQVVLDVETAIGQRLARRLTIDTLDQGTSTTLAPEEGTRVGVVLHRRDGAWRATACDRVDPDGLLEAANGPQAPQQGTAAFVIAGHYGPARLAALDRQGQPVAFGAGDYREAAEALHTCPHNRFLVERAGPPYWDGGREPRVIVRDLATLEPAWEVDVAELMNDDPRSGPNVVRGVACADGDGQAVHVLMGWYEPPAADGREAWQLWRVTPGDHELVATGEIESLQTVGDELMARLEGHQWAIIDPDTGSPRQQLELPGDTRQLVLSTDREHVWALAGPARLSDTPDVPYRLLRSAWPATRPPQSQRELPDSAGTAVSLAAHGDGALAMMGTTATRRFHRFDADLHQTDNWIADRVVDLQSVDGDVIGRTPDALRRALANADDFDEFAAIHELSATTMLGLADPIEVHAPWDPPGQPTYDADQLPADGSAAQAARRLLGTWQMWPLLVAAAVGVITLHKARSARHSRARS